METTLCVARGERRVPVICRSKRIKNVHLRVYPDGRVLLSMPVRTDSVWIRTFLEAKSDWIFRTLDRYARAGKPEEGAVRLFGRLRTLRVERGRSGAALGEDALVLTLPDPTAERVRARTDRFVRELALSYFRERTDFFYPRVAALGAPEPSVRVRRMKSMWGNCNATKAAVCFNTVLVCADPECIDYVVVHELTHLLVPGHGKNFYECLARILPDWKQRRARLNRLYAKYL